MAILGAVIVPHPPLIISTVGHGREQEVQSTIDAYRAATKQAVAWNPEVLIITSPHQIMYSDYFHICTFCDRPEWTVPSSASACPGFLPWTTTGWGSASLRPWRTWDVGLCSLPAATCPTS